MTPDTTVGPPQPSRWRPFWISALALIVLAFVVMWVYIFAFADRSGVDVIEDKAWAARAEATCATARVTIRALPFVDPADTSRAGLLARADAVETGNVALEAMLATLAADQPADEVGRAVIPKWLDDWRTYLADRQRYVTGLRDGSQTKFAETLVTGGPISNFIRDLATHNRMLSCAAPPLT